MRAAAAYVERCGARALRAQRALQLDAEVEDVLTRAARGGLRGRRRWGSSRGSWRRRGARSDTRRSGGVPRRIGCSGGVAAKAGSGAFGPVSAAERATGRGRLVTRHCDRSQFQKITQSRTSFKSEVAIPYECHDI